MMKSPHMHTFTPEEALAQGALAANIQMATSYPGSPGIGVMNTLIASAKENPDLYIEWSTNERVALEMCIGSSMAGKRSLVCVKSVGMNVLLDPLMTLNLTGTHGGLVILLGDDPGAYGSQNEQDSRLLAPFIEIPFLEPASPAEAYALMLAAFGLSERFETAIVIRITRSFTQQPGSRIPLVNAVNETLGLDRRPYRFVPYPGNAVALHRAQHEKLTKFESWLNSADWDQMCGLGIKGVVATGFCYSKLLEVLRAAKEENPDSVENLRILKLSSLFPLPKNTIAHFLQECEEILVLEEPDAFIENSLKILSHDLATRTKIIGKNSGHFPHGDELLRWQIQAALEKFIPGFIGKQSFVKADQAEERPTKKNHCAASPNEHILALLNETAEELGQKPILISDPGCWVKVAGELDGKFAIGSSVAVASGLNKAGVNERVVALFGDSAFFHTAIPAICNTAYNGSPVFMVVIDNCGALSTGRQPTPASGIDAGGNPAHRLWIEEIARACGVTKITRLPVETSAAEIKQSLNAGLSTQSLSMLIIET